jgi:hypothetical protein
VTKVEKFYGAPTPYQRLQQHMLPRLHQLVTTLPALVPSDWDSARPGIRGLASTGLVMPVKRQYHVGVAIATLVITNPADPHAD